MPRFRRFMAPLAVLVAAACGGPDPAPNLTLSATDAGATEAAPLLTTTVPPTTVPPTTVPPTTVTPTTVTRPAPPTTAARPTTSAVRRTTTTHALTLTPGRKYAPAPPPPGVQADGYAGYGGLTSTSEGGTTVTLQVYPRESYFGETTQVWVGVTHTEAVSALTLDFGNGHVVNLPPAGYWPCARVAKHAGGSQWYTYPVAGQYRITATVTVTPCQILPGPAGGWTNPDGTPAVDFPEPWLPTGPPHTVSAGMDVLQRPDPPPRPVGPPPGA